MRCVLSVCRPRARGSVDICLASLHVSLSTSVGIRCCCRHLLLGCVCCWIWVKGSGVHAGLTQTLNPSPRVCIQQWVHQVCHQLSITHGFLRPLHLQCVRAAMHALLLMIVCRKRNASRCTAMSCHSPKMPHPVVDPARAVIH